MSSLFGLCVLSNVVGLAFHIVISPLFLFITNSFVVVSETYPTFGDCSVISILKFPFP